MNALCGKETQEDCCENGNLQQGLPRQLRGIFYLFAFHAHCLVLSSAVKAIGPKMLAAYGYRTIDRS
jgi:hypothetical protein